MATQPSIQDELAARGLAAYNGNMRFAPATAPAAPTNGAAGASVSPGVRAATQPRSLSMGDVGNAVAQEQDIPPQMQQAFQQADEQTGGNGATVVASLIAAGVLGASAMALYRQYRNRMAGGNASGVDPSATVLEPDTTSTGRGVATRPENIIDGEFSEVQPAQVGRQRLLPSPEAPLPNRGQSAEEPTVARALTENSRRARARGIGARGTTPQPNDISTINAPDEFPYTEEDVRRANALADELIAQRLRGQGQVARGRARAGAPSAPIYAPRSNEPIANQRPALVNEILRIMQNAARNPGVARAIPRVVP